MIALNKAVIPSESVILSKSVILSAAKDLESQVAPSMPTPVRRSPLFRIPHSAFRIFLPYTPAFDSVEQLWGPDNVVG